MINNISWQGYWIGIAFVTGIYYLIIFLFYFRNDFKNRFVTRKVTSILSTNIPFETNNKSLHQRELLPEEFSPVSFDEEKPEVIPVVQLLIDEVQAFFEEAKQKRVAKSDLLVSLKGICKKYPSVSDSPSRNSVNQLIIFLAEQDCSIHLNVDEVSSVWWG